MALNSSTGPAGGLSSSSRTSFDSLLTSLEAVYFQSAFEVGPTGAVLTVIDEERAAVAVGVGQPRGEPYGRVEVVEGGLLISFIIVEQTALEIGVPRLGVELQRFLEIGPAPARAARSGRTPRLGSSRPSAFRDVCE